MNISENSNFELLFPFLILLFIALIRFIKTKKKREELSKPVVRRSSPSVTLPRKNKSPPPVLPLSPVVSKSLELDKMQLRRENDKYYLHKKKETRIQVLVSSAGDKRKMILLSEILQKPYF